MKDRHGHEWSHKGLMYGFVPVYINNPYSETPEISGRNLACDILFDIADAFFFFLSALSLQMNPCSFSKLPESASER